MNEGTNTLCNNAISRVGYIDIKCPVQGYSTPLSLAIASGTRSAKTLASFMPERLSPIWINAYTLVTTTTIHNMYNSHIALVLKVITTIVAVPLALYPSIIRKSVQDFQTYLLLMGTEIKVLDFD